MRNEVQIAGALSAVECVVAAHLHEPTLADPEFAVVSLCVEVRPFATMRAPAGTVDGHGALIVPGVTRVGPQ